MKILINSSMYSITEIQKAAIQYLNENDVLFVPDDEEVVGFFFYEDVVDVVTYDYYNIYRYQVVISKLL